MPQGGLPAADDERRLDVGTDDFATRRCTEVAERATTLLGRIADLPTAASPHQPAVQTAALLLRLCGCGKVAHLLRSCPPAATRPAAQLFDREVLSAYTRLARLDPSLSTKRCSANFRSGLAAGACAARSGWRPLLGSPRGRSVWPRSRSALASSAFWTLTTANSRLQGPAERHWPPCRHPVRPPTARGWNSTGGALQRSPACSFSGHQQPARPTNSNLTC